MRITAFILLGFALHVSARVSSQHITYAGDKVPLVKIFSVIKEQTGYSVLYNPKLITNSQPVSITANKMGLETFLNEILRATTLQYLIQEESIIISKKTEKPAVDLSHPLLSPPPITGVVRGPDGQPIAGVNVVVKGTKKGVVTDAYGRFSIEAEVGKTLVISNIGYNAREIKVNGDNNIIVGLEISTSKLDEVQVIAYGTSSQRFQTGNVASVKAKDIEKSPVSNPLLALQGRVPGLSVTQANGFPGSGITVRIQGVNSIMNGSDPLYVVDGVPYPSELPSELNLGPLGNSGGRVSETPTGSGNAINYLNPTDIESIEILKDADATAIYGSRAANGAILITTKKASQGRSSFDINVQHGWGKVTRKLKMLSTPQYLEMRREALANDGIVPQIDNPFEEGYAPDLLFWDTTKYTDWQDVMIGNTAHFTNFNAGLSGGNSNTQYLVRGTYIKETTVLPGKFADVKGAVNFSLKNISVNRKLKFELSGTYLVDNNELPAQDRTRDGALLLAPNAPEMYNEDGTINWRTTPAGNATWYNPMARLSQTYQNKTSNLIANTVVSYSLFPGLEIRSSLGYNNIISNEYQLNPLTWIRPEWRSFMTRTSVFGNRRMNSWIIEPQVLYKKNIGSGKVEGLLGATVQRNSVEGSIINGSGYATDLVLKDIKSAASLFVVSSTSAAYKYAAFFGRLNYILKDKYIVNFTGRRDGSSRFGANNQFANFMAAGGAWVFSEENFLNQPAGFLSFGKLRGSYGTTGSDQIGDYRYLNLYTPVNSGVPYQSYAGLTPSGIPNPYLSWEMTKKLQFGFDLGFFQDKLLITTNYVRNSSTNQLLPYTLPSVTGQTSVFQNFPATILNKNVEFSISTSSLKIRKATWSSSFNLTIPCNELIEFPDIENSPYASGFGGVIVGQPLGVQKVFQFMGVDPATGQYAVADGNGIPTSSPNWETAGRILVNLQPRFFGGFQNTFHYSGIQLDVLFQFVNQKAVNSQFNGNSNIVPGVYTPYAGTNQPVTVLARWRKPGDITNIQRYSTSFDVIRTFGNASASNARITDASFIRLKNVSMSYAIPAKITNKLHMQKGRLYVQAQNLLTFSKFQGLDPENQSVEGSPLPVLKMITAGLQITL